jgi:hypothetical protein
VIDTDKSESERFCDELGCSRDHILRQHLPLLLAKVREEERARCLDIIETEDELAETPPPIVEALLMRTSQVEVARMVVGTTKKSIARRIIHGKDFKCLCDGGSVGFLICPVHGPANLNKLEIPDA